MPSTTMARRWLWAALALLSGCASAPSQLVTAARNDLRCADVEVTKAGDGRYAASGCGRGAIYAQACGSGGCTWGRLPGVTPPAPVVATPPSTAGGERTVVAAPPPAEREVTPAPAPEGAQPRQVIPAPPPAGEAPASANDQPPPAEEGTDASPGSAAPARTPLSQGELTEPYQTEVPQTPAVQRSEYPPPAPLVEVRPTPPSPSYVWVSGYWWWNTPRWVWAPGYWCPPRYGFSYVPGSWYWSSGYWWYGPGGWARPGSTYIVHHVNPRPRRVETTRAFTPHHHVRGLPASRSAESFHRVGRSPAPAPRTYSPRSSPMYRYPTALSNPLQSSQFRARGVAPAARGAAPATRAGSAVRRGPSSYGVRSDSYRSSARAPVFPSRPLPAARGADVARGRVYGGGGSTVRQGGLQMRAPSSRGGFGGGGSRAPAPARRAPRGR